MKGKYQVCLTTEERSRLNTIVLSGIAPNRVITRAQILLRTDSGQNGPRWTYREICKTFHVSGPTITKIRKLFIEEGLIPAIHGCKSKRWYKLALGGKNNANSMAVTCIKGSKDLAGWSLRLVRDRFVKLGFIESDCSELVWTPLKVNELETLLKKMDIPPAKETGFLKELEFVQINNGLHNHNCLRPGIDEVRKQVTFNDCPPPLLQIGRLDRVKHSNGSDFLAKRFTFFRPFGGVQYVEVADRRPRHEWEAILRELLEILYNSENIVVVIENLDNQSRLSLFQKFFSII